MRFRRFDIEGPCELIPEPIGDDRGYFAELFRLDAFRDVAGDVQFVQDNQSLSVLPGTIRGIHFQSRPAAQGKLVRCLAGSVFDVVVDLRSGSPTFGQYLAITLAADRNNQLWIPAGFGHGFCTLEPNSIIYYRVTDYYSAENDKGVAWDDRDIGVKWPTIADRATLSPKDSAQPRLTDLPPYFSIKD